ncbi:TetR/AcrR family transcriptional regulator [Flavobacterium sp. NRK F10]|uniref:TetR/AcrR family transcriptional regulator n=1 Tax=Flavobacterium sp. NRK F10 TaxID=2954931 RepID=UPI0020904839|nr:TetR/AcrR family transcriptional regulator [Flavobacterium sp. NRK F10]MCO6175806.1 TetR/AcrR family transcriptional regulator [Flavobacterium sp. NRK F10]
MAGRPRIYNADQALDQAIEVFWQKGYENASSDDLLKAMGIGKGSFYLAYKGGKQELFQKSLDRVMDHHIKAFKDKIELSEHPLEEIRVFFYEMADPETNLGKYGCYFANALIQVSDKDLKCSAEKQLRTLKDIFVKALEKEKMQGNLKTAVTPDLLGLHLLNLWSGLNVTRNTVNDKSELKMLIEMNLRCIQ